MPQDTLLAQFNERKRKEFRKAFPQDDFHREEWLDMQIMPKQIWNWIEKSHQELLGKVIEGIKIKR